DPNVDPLGACVGPKGTRVANIVSEIHEEKIDIIKWSEDPVTYIANALSPSKVLMVRIEETDPKRRATVVVPDNQLSLAIGKRGQNAMLCARLTGWSIDIKSESQMPEAALIEEENIED
ncbi:MAG: transcription termination/antitermination protein NusA, partial [Clostridia bacterium]|nr:transcription termination/antitermination protein NusA [Clostridia bacterium]